jgi:hypothetical protein
MSYTDEDPQHYRCKGPKHKRLVTLLVQSLLWYMLPAALWAAEAREEGDTHEVASDEIGVVHLEETVITASRMSKSSFDVPSVVDVI